MGPTWEEAGETRVDLMRQGANLFGGNWFEFFGANVVPVANVTANTTLRYNHHSQGQRQRYNTAHCMHALQLSHLRNSCDIAGVMTAGPTPMASASSPSA